jgi:formamidopyrimidine-DNA glycosylase
MPEGDTILRTARSLATWLEGREVTAARSRTVKAPLQRVVGRRIEQVEARAKHLLIRFSGGAVLHTHMQMTGSWHIYSRGERWRKPTWQAAAVLEAGDHVAVCFDAPVVELLDERAAAAHPALAGLGPDVLRPPVDLDEVRRRAAQRPPDIPVGELLLDQQVVSGIGNIWRCEVLFVRKVHPWTRHASLATDELDALVLEAGRLMAAGRRERWVYGRAGRPCRRCGTPVAVQRSGDGGRNLFWCPTCQGAA